MQLIGQRSSARARQAARSIKQGIKQAAGKAGGKLARGAQSAKNLARRGFKPVGFVLRARRGVLSLGYAAEMAGVGGPLGYLSGLADENGYKNGYVQGGVAFILGLVALLMKPRSDKWKMRYTTSGSALMGIAFFLFGKEVKQRRRLAAASAANAGN